MHRRCGSMVDGLAPVLGLVHGCGTHRRPNLDIARRSPRGWQRARSASGSRVRPRRASGSAKTRSTACSTSSVERNESFRPHASKGRPAALTRSPQTPCRCRRKRPATRPETNRWIASRRRRRKWCVRLFACTKPREEFGGQVIDHRPLLRTGVLRLVEQDVVDALVELVLDPRPGVGPRQQTRRSIDQIVEIEKASRPPSAAHSGRSASRRRQGG